MAYKFQIGAARLSGSIIQSDGSLDARAATLDSLDNSSGGITNAGAIAGATTISGSSNLSVGGTIAAGNNTFQVDAAGAVTAVGVNAGGAVTGVTTLAASGLMSVASISLDDGSTIGPDSVSDLITLSADGDFTFKDGAHDLNIASHDGTNGLALGGTIVTSDATELNLLDGSGAGNVVNSKAVIYSSAGQVNGTTLSASSNVSAGGTFFGAAIALADASGIAGTGIDNNSGELQVATAQTLIESITNNSLVLEGNGSIKLDLQNSGIAKFLIGSDDKLIVNTSGVTIPGNLTVQGTTTTIDSTTINVSRSFTFEGTASDFETTFGYGATGAPIQDITVVLPEYSSSAGAHSVKAAVIAAGSTAANYAAAALVTAEEFKILDGSTADSSVSIADTDQMIINDNGTMLQTAMSDLKSYVGSGISETVKDLSGNNTPVAGVNYYASNLTSTQTVTLPASAGMAVGQKVRIKAPSDCSNTVKVVINRDGTQLMDGSLESISLESPFAAVELVYVAANAWRIF